MAALISKPGITNASTLSIPKTWDGAWFRSFINSSLTGADVRNAVGTGGISVTGTLASPYATIGFAPPVTMNGVSGSPVLTLNAVNSVNPAQAIVANNDGVHDLEILVSTVTAGDAYYRAVALGVINWSFGTRRSDGSFCIAPHVGLASPALLISSIGSVIINTPGATTALVVNGAANQYAIIGQASSTTGQSYGMFIKGGSNSSDRSVSIREKTGTNDYFVIRGDGAIFCTGSSTTANAANAFLDSGSSPVNNLLRSTSSLRYKTNVQSIQSADIDALLQMRPVTYTSLCAADDPKTQHLGFIAEEMALIDPRLVQYRPGQVNEDGSPVIGSPPIPESVSYDRLTVLLVGAIQTLVQRVAAFEAKTVATVPPVGPPPPALSLSSSYSLTGTNVVTAPSVLTVIQPT